MGVINTELLNLNIKSEFLGRFKELAGDALHDKIATRIVSTKDNETYKWLGTVPPMREWGTGRLAKGLRTESYVVENLKYEATLEVDRDEISDDHTGQIRIRIAELAKRAATHKDLLIAGLLANGATAGFNSYDGVSFFNDAHVSGASGSQDNKLAPAATIPADPTTVEFKTSLRAAIAQMLGFMDDQGEPMMDGTSGLMCLVPNEMYYSALESVNATIISNTSNVTASAADVHPFSRLTDATSWYLIKTDGIVRPFIFQDREPIEFDSLEEGSTEDFMREKFLYGVRARYRMTYGYWQYAVKSTFA